MHTGVHVKDHKQPCTSDGNEPAEPDRPAVAAGAGHEEADDDGGGEKGARDGDHGYADNSGSVGTDGREVEGDVIELAEDL